MESTTVCTTPQTDNVIVPARIFLTLLSTSLGCCLSLPAANAADAKALSVAVESITVAELRAHVNVLASDTFEGREAGSRGGKAAGVYLIGELKKLGVTAGGEKSFFQFFGNDYRNVLAVIPGSDPALKQEYIVVSSHYDHVGFGTARNSYGPTGYIHNGADDNASGTSGLLELIEALLTIEPAPKRSILFAFWDAEEKGLLGSEHWIAHPTVPLSSVKMMINLDMIGRLRQNTLAVYGVRTAVGYRRLVSEQNRPTDLTLDFNWENKRESDHYPFYARRIPFLMFHTKKHENYHRPSDDVDKLNVDGIQRVVRLLFRTVYTAAESPELPRFRPAAMRENQSVRRRRLQPLRQRASRLGVTWDDKPAGKGTIKITRVSSGSAAERGGLHVGDRVISFGNYRIDRTELFSMIVLAAENPVRVVVERNGETEPVELTLQLKETPQRLGVSWRTDDAEPGIVTLTRVTPGSAGDRAGLKPNHRIYAVSGRAFNSGDEFYKLVTTVEAPLKLLVEGRGQLREVEVKLLPKPSMENSPRADALGRRAP